MFPSPHLSPCLRQGSRVYALAPALSGYFASASHFSLGLQAPVALSHIDVVGGCHGNSSRSGCFPGLGHRGSTGEAALLLVRGKLGPQDRLAVCGKSLLGPHIWEEVCGASPQHAEPPGLHHLCSCGGSSDRNSPEQRGRGAAEQRDAEPVGIVGMEGG